MKSVMYPHKSITRSGQSGEQGGQACDLHDQSNYLHNPDSSTV
jgi:hypothetical protein